VKKLKSEPQNVEQGMSKAEGRIRAIKLMSS